ncbi:MAG: ABC transporter permease subunit, partial [Candidatus Binatia bacterium]
MNTFDLLVEYRLEFLHGLWVTTKMCLLIWSIGIIAGSSLAVAGAKWKKTIGTSSKIASFILGGIPILVFLFWMHYPMQAILNVVIDPFVTAVATFSVVNTFLVADLIRGVLNDFPTQYISAAQAYGLTHRDTILHIQFPMILRQVLPNLLF